MANHKQSGWLKNVRHPAITVCGATLFIGMAGMAPIQATTAGAPTSETRQDGAVIGFDLPAEPLAETLRAISQQSGRPVEFNPADVKGIQAPPIKGRFTAAAALQAAVAGTPLSMASGSNSGWFVFDPKTLGVVAVTANVNEAETGFQATRSETATRSSSDLMDTPESMTIITSDVMKSQQALSIQDVLQDVSGVQAQAGTQGPPSFSIRGLPGLSLSNGLPNQFADLTSVASVERIEVLKGPQAILAGSSTLGGAVNIVTKKPSADPIAEVSFQDGTYGDKTATADFSDALTDNKKLSGRIIGSWTRAAASDAHYDGRTENYVMPEIRWKDDRTDFNVGLSYDDEFDPLGRYTFALGNSINPLAINPIPTMRLGSKHNGNEVKTRSLFYSLEREVAPWLTVVSRAERALTTQDLNVWLPLFPLDSQSMTLAYSPTNGLTRYGTTSTDNYLRFTFRTGPLQHVLSTGLNTSILNYAQYDYGLPGFSPVQVESSQQFDFPKLVRNTSTLQATSQFKTQQYGLYAQDLITWGNLHALLNFRRDYYADGPGFTNQYGFSSVSPKQPIYKSTPGVGVVYNVTPDVSVYGSYAKGFSPNFTTAMLCGGGTEVLPSQTSTNKELGIKITSPGGFFSLTSSAFDLNQANVVQYNGALNCYSMIKGQRTRGLEVDAQGQLAEGWKLLANYTHSLYTNIGQPDILIVGEPKNHFNLWTVYEFQGGPLQGFGVGGGITAYDRSYTFYQQGYPTEPGGARVDLSAYYHWKHRWSFIFGVKNVFDRTLYGTTVTPLYLPVEQGRTFRFTVKYNFL